ncbi:bZIP transcription factor 16-like [Andrographis paniculata]|uniref:bZIP transcription factor 16-like n=1 Tax=Andrographis paniculata TaxID=175694 RepID=UPI0021E7AF6E|nr:bZIP transcription factor 16-like [Andrographis paniculata]
MGSSEVDKSSREGKESKEPKTPTAQEQTSAATGAMAPDWSGFQAYSPMPPPGFMASSPQTHPYMWGQFIPPYGTPPPHPYVAMYPHGVYAHPSMGSYPFSPFAMPSPSSGIAEASSNTPGVDLDGKPSEAKGKLPIKRSRGSLGSLNMITGKNNEPGKTSDTTANGVHSKSAGSGSEGSSEGSDTNSQTESQGKTGGQHDSEEPAQNGSTAHSAQSGAPNTPNVVAGQTMTVMPMPAVGAMSGPPGPTTNLNIGMDYWSAAAPSPAIPTMRGKVQQPAAVAGGVVATTGSRDSAQPQHWIQDERELKRQRRKQSNRESARRSRLRKQAECDELAKRADTLKEENASLRAELERAKSEYEQLRAEHASLQEKLGEHNGQEDPRSNGDEQADSRKSAQ